MFLKCLLKDYIGSFICKDCKNNNILYQAKSFSYSRKVLLTVVRKELLCYGLIKDDITEVKEHREFLIAAIVIVQTYAERAQRRMPDH